MTHQADDAREVLRAVWAAQGESSADLDEDCSPTKSCKNMQSVTLRRVRRTRQRPGRRVAGEAGSRGEAEHVRRQHPRAGPRSARAALTAASTSRRIGRPTVSEGRIDRPETVAELTDLLRGGGYLADRGLGHRALRLVVAGTPDPARRRGRRRQDRGRQGAGVGVRPPADPAAVLRGHRHEPGAVRVGLRPPDAADPGAVRAPARGRGRGRQAVRPEVPAGAAVAGGGPRRRPGGAADRRDRPSRRRVRGVPARAAVGLPDHASPRSAPSRPRRRRWSSSPPTAPASCTTP